VAAPGSLPLSVSIVAAVLLVGGAIAGIVVGERDVGSGRAQGTVVVEGTSFGTFTFSVDTCTAVRMADPDTSGVDLRGPDGNALRLVSDGREAQMWFYPARAGGGAIPIGRNDCSVWNPQLFLEAGGPFPIGGDATVACTMGGGKFNAAVTFQHCRP